MTEEITQAPRYVHLDCRASYIIKNYWKRYIGLLSTNDNGKIFGDLKNYVLEKKMNQEKNT